MKKIFLWILGIFILLFGLLIYIYFMVEPQKINKVINHFAQIKYDEEPKNLLEKEAKKQIGKVLTYDFSQGYYKNGRPSDLTTGVCTDVVKELNYDLKNRVFNDLKKHPQLYPDTPDKNINFRRAKNLNIYFKRFEKTLTISLDKKDLQEWLGGDIVIWKDHIAIVSSIKRKDGLPYVILNHGRGVILADIIDTWPTELIGHYRIKKLK